MFRIIFNLTTLTIMLLMSCGKQADTLQTLDKVPVELTATKTVNEDQTLNSLVNIKAQFCTLEATKVKSNLKITIIMDKSGSNQDSVSGDFVGTDPYGYRRYQPLISYLNNATFDDSVYYSLINFSTSASIVNQYKDELGRWQYYKDSQGNISNYTNSKDYFLRTIQYQSNPNNTNPPRPSDGGWTNFLAALSKVKEMIVDDINKAKQATEPVASYYVIIFISDGAPWVGPVDNINNLQNKTDIINSIKGIIALEEANRLYVEGIQLHTGFYYSDIKDMQDHLRAQEYMADMAAAGNGDAYQFSKGEVIDFKKFAIPERKIKSSLKDVFVVNANGVWNKDSYLHDSDSDGVADDIEDELGSNKLLKDSDSNGVSDGVEYFLFTKPCKDSQCKSENAEPFEMCASFIITNQNGVKIFKDSDADGLNDCEELLLKSKYDNFDSNFDWIPDLLAFKASIAFSPSNVDSHLDPDKDGINSYTELKINTPANYNNLKISNLIPYEYNLTMTSSDFNKTCYSLDVNKVYWFSKNDNIQIYLLENSSVIDNKRYLRVAQKPVGETSHDSLLIFKEQDFNLISK